MSETVEAQATCLCGATRLVAKTVSTEMGACHCGMCRKWSGGPLLAVDCGTDVTIEGAENVTLYSSSEWAERGFCNKCGTNLFYRLKEQNQYIVPVGLFDGLTGVNFDHQIFIDEKPPYYQFENQTKNMTGAEVFALYAPPNE